MPYQMRSLLVAFKYKPILLTGFAWGWLEVEVLPKPMAIFCLGMVMTVDLVTGVVKSWKKHEATTSSGFQRTVVKLTRYCSLILATWALAYVLRDNSPKNVNYSFIVNGAIGFLTFIEIYSVFENIYEIEPTGPLSKWFVGPVLKLLRGKLKNNPINEALNDSDSEPGN